jgi:hypothetical protein
LSSFTVIVGMVIPAYYHEAQYTASAMRAGIEGAVRLQAVVNADGTVGDVMVSALPGADTWIGSDDEPILYFHDRIRDRESVRCECHLPLVDGRVLS